MSAPDKSMQVESSTVVASVTSQGKVSLASLALVGFGPFMLLLMPVFVGAVSRELGFSTRELGYLASAELAGLTLVSVLAGLWLGRFTTRNLAIAGVALMAAANFACILTTTVPAFIACRLLAGIGGGTLLALGTALIATFPKPDRLYAFAIALQVSSAAIGLYLLPGVFERAGIDSGLVVIGLVPLMLLPLIAWLPTGRPRAQSPRLFGHRRNTAAVQILASTLVFSLGVGGVWAYVEQMGTAQGLGTKFLSSALAGAMVVSFIGALFASWLEARVGRRIPLLIGILGQSAGLLLLGGELSEPVFLASVLTFNFFWSFVGPYQLGALSSVDHSGEHAALLPGFQGVGFAAEPALAAEILVRAGHPALTFMGIACLLASLALILPRTPAAGSRRS